ncbi:predicted protein [Plenodomus lingam JN3]|uniref:Uncharacterized protein n=1 Tax=Leptosphaeria maculans (strain JN3 / isolate v23.1.3 / race Av1-4-5-6-7-8) TaxID=985895 RepID=E4ZGD7_LEPMJ|nr:predicted protein [Plenodomus lingam JN3]CBX90357.1 predicted protein [Plenodomus lingam JN3]
MLTRRIPVLRQTATFCFPILQRQPITSLLHDCGVLVILSDTLVSASISVLSYAGGGGGLGIL